MKPGKVPNDWRAKPYTDPADGKQLSWDKEARYFRSTCPPVIANGVICTHGGAEGRYSQFLATQLPATPEGAAASHSGELPALGHRESRRG